MSRGRLRKLIDDMNFMDIHHFMDCGTLAWGKISGCPVYIRRFDSGVLDIPEETMSSNTIHNITELQSESNTFKDKVVLIVCKNEENESLIFVFKSGELKEVGFMDIQRKIVEKTGDVGFSCKMIHTFESLKYVRDKSSLLDLYWKVYVPFVDGSNGSKLPVMWYAPVAGPVTGTLITGANQTKVLSQLEDTAHFLIGKLKESLPSIDLKESEEGRYKYFTFVDTNYMYNRNHLGFNGKIFDIMAIAPIVLRVIYNRLEDIESESIISYLNGIPGVEPYIKLYENDDANNNESMNEDKPKSGLQIGAVGTGKIGGCANALLNAARKANPGYTEDK